MVDGIFNGATESLSDGTLLCRPLGVRLGIAVGLEDGYLDGIVLGSSEGKNDG
jgi:hypothetical protein